jgi:hypothetical protein
MALRLKDLEAALPGLIVHVRRSVSGEGDAVAVREVAVRHAEHLHLDPILELEVWLQRMRAALTGHLDPGGAAPDHPGTPAIKPSTAGQLRALLAELTGPVFRFIIRNGRFCAQGHPGARPETPFGHSVIR